MLIESQIVYFATCLIAVKPIAIPNNNRMLSVDLVLSAKKDHMATIHIIKKKYKKK